MCKNPVLKKVYNYYGDFLKFIEFPCGGCLSCRLDQQILWEQRCQVEFVHNNCSFLTLTYDDYHLRYFDQGIFPSLCIDDCTKFIDNLRHKVKYINLPKGNVKDFSYFGCGEYGDRFQRPHMHFLIFGLDYLDCEKLYKDSWTNGLIKSLPIMSGGVRYVVDYMTKNINGLQAVELYDKKGRERPFYVNSKGLGSDFFFQHRQEIAETGLVTVHGRHIPVPSYYKRLCMRFDVDTLSKLNQSNFRRSQHDKLDAKKRHMSYDDFMKYKRDSKELSLAKKYIHEGKPILNTSVFNLDKKINYDIILSALDIA